MIRLTLLLLAGLGAALVIGGRDVKDTQVAQLKGAGSDLNPVQAARADTARPDAQPGAAAVTRGAADPATDQVDGAAVKAAVAQALDTQPKKPAMTGTQAMAQARATVKATVGDTPAGSASANARMAAATGSADPTGDGNTSHATTVASANPGTDVQYVNGTVVNVRAGPSTSYSVVGQVKYGDAAQVMSDPAKSWVRIRSASDGVEGYIFHKYIQPRNPQG